MRLWTYSTNMCYKKANYVLEESSWYIFLIQNSIMLICDLIPSLPIPFGSKIKILDEDTNKKISLKEYYTDISCLFHCTICNKITKWTFSKIKTYNIETDFEELKKIFEKESPNMFKMEE